MKKLNLGSGGYKKEGFVNLDVSEDLSPDVVHDLEEFPYPFDGGTFDLIEADHVLEHLSDAFLVMEEIERILNAGGRAVIRVPHFSRAMTHPQHKRGFDVTFPMYFDEAAFGSYTGTRLICERLRLRWFAQRYLMKEILPKGTYLLLSAIGAVIDLFANASPLFCSRVWCFWVGGFYEIEFVFRKPEK